MERIKDWPELRAALLRTAGNHAAQELDRLLAADQKVQAIRLLRRNGISPVDPARPTKPRPR